MTIAVDLQGAIRSAVLARWSGARMVYGAAEPRESPASLWYTRPVIARGMHVIEQNLSVAEAVAQKKLSLPRVEFPRDVEAERRMEQRLAAAAIGEFAILNPGAGWGAKRWPAQRYGQVANALARDGVHSILNCGPGEDALAREAEAASEGAAMAMKCSISELIALTRRAKLFVGGDTGPLHLAAALEVPRRGDLRARQIPRATALIGRPTPRAALSCAIRKARLRMLAGRSPTKACWRSPLMPSWTAARSLLDKTVLE